MDTRTSLAKLQMPRVNPYIPEDYARTLKASMCDHPARTFNGYVWRCKECGKKLK